MNGKMPRNTLKSGTFSDVTIASNKLFSGNCLSNGK